MDNVVLIGMPGCGKTTVGKWLARSLGMHFVDTDRVIEQQMHMPLSQILDELGQEGFRETENRICAGIEDHCAVIATGGSVVYGQEAMQHLRKIGVVVYLEVSEESLLLRLKDLHARGVTMSPGQSFSDLYAERCPLYKKWAHLILHTEGMSMKSVVDVLSRNLRKRLSLSARNQAEPQAPVSE
ncbi:MAG: shikimate kinase [Clostridia bacterium]|nr:shikimate kinase [Clostridia bacterium]